MIPDDDDSGDSLILQRRQQPTMILDPLPPAMIPDDRNISEENPKVPKKWSETWVQEETRTLISLRRKIDSKHLWDQISAKMRNLLKEFKKYKQRPSSDPKSSSPALQFSDNVFLGLDWMKVNLKL